MGLSPPKFPNPFHTHGGALWIFYHGVYSYMILHSPGLVTWSFPEVFAEDNWRCVFTYPSAHGSTRTKQSDTGLESQHPGGGRRVGLCEVEASLTLWVPGISDIHSEALSISKEGRGKGGRKGGRADLSKQKVDKLQGRILHWWMWEAGSLIYTKSLDRNGRSALSIRRQWKEETQRKNK